MKFGVKIPASGNTRNVVGNPKKPLSNETDNDTIYIAFSQYDIGIGAIQRSQISY